MLHIYSIICNWLNVTEPTMAVALGYSFKLTVNMQDMLYKETPTPEIQTMTLHISSSTNSLRQHDVINTVFPFYSASFAHSCMQKQERARLSRELNRSVLHQRPWHGTPATIGAQMLICYRWD